MQVYGKPQKKDVPLLDLKAQYAKISTEIETSVKSVLNSQQFILGPEVKALEKEIANYCQCEFGIGCASGSDALLLALMACGVGQGDEVITTPFTFFATAASVVRLGGRPVFVDIDPSSYNIDAKLIKDAITDRTRAIMPVQLFGQCADMDEINEVAGRHALHVIEDAAQAIGAEYKQRRAGSLSTAAAFSFYPSKNLGGAGDGGAITTNSPELAEKLHSLRAHGSKNKYYHEVVGINSRLDSLQAAILRVKLRYLDEWALSRRQNAANYRMLFAQTGLIEGSKIGLPDESAGMLHVFNQFVIRAENRDQLKAYLWEWGIGTEVYYPLCLHLQDCFEYLGYTEGDFPESERASREALAIPIFPELDGAAQEYVVERIEAFYG